MTPDGSMVVASPNERQHGYSAAELVRIRLADLCFQADLAAIAREYVASLDQGKVTR